MPTLSKSLALVFALSSMMLLGGCASTVIQQHTAAPQNTVVNLVATPGTAVSLTASQTIQLGATNGGSNEPMSWAIGDPNEAFGSVTSNGLFTAPASVTNNNIVVVSGTSLIHPGSGVAIQITLSNPRPTVSSVSPSTAAANTPYAGVIAGMNFTPGSIVMVNGVSVASTVLSDTSIRFAATPIGSARATLNVQVVTPLPGGGTSPSLMLPVVDGSVSYDAAVRFLKQASWGPTPESITHVQQVGFSKYIDEQIAMPVDSLVTDDDFLHVYENVFNNGLYKPSQLRQKMMWTWYRLFNAPGSTMLAWLSSFPEQLQRDAFANYSKILYDASLETTNGLALSNIGNSAGPNPNQNYGRELMQLFSVGPLVLNLDGTVVLDGNSQVVSEYTQTDVTEMARAMTGWNQSPDYNTDVEGVTPMVESKAWGSHDEGDKTVLGTLIPGGGDADSDMKATVNLLANQPNTAAFMSLRLIHSFVTSNPTPAYVSRISSVWLDDGTSSRGNVAAVIKAILLDPEARAGDDSNSEPAATQGRAMDAVEYMMAVNRTLGTQGQIGGASWMAGCGMNECVLDAPSVFGYYMSSYTLPGTNTLAPELSLFTTAALQQKANYVSNVLSQSVDNYSVSVDLLSWTALANGDGSKLIDTINHNCLHGTMSPGLKSVLQQAYGEVSPDNQDAQARRLLYLTLMSPEFAVIR